MPEIDFAARRAWFADWWAGLLAAGAEAWCAWDARGALAGFVTIDPAGGYLDQLAVAPAAFGTGVGGSLLDHAKARSPGRVWLRVNAENPRAVRFYRRAGFAVTGEGTNPGGTRPVLEMRWVRER